jgi:hypothetical protein
MRGLEIRLNSDNLCIRQGSIITLAIRHYFDNVTTSNYQLYSMSIVYKHVVVINVSSPLAMYTHKLYILCNEIKAMSSLSLQP